MSESKKQFKILGSISLLLVGTFLIGEHIYTYGGIDLLDILGHEWFGILFIIAGLLLANRKWTQVLSPLQYALEKIKNKKNK